MIEAKEVLAGDISVKESLAGEINNGVKVVSPSLIDLEVTPSKEKKTYKHEGSYGYDNVVVNAIPDDYIIPSLEAKVITPAKEVQTVVADEGYDGLSGVTVNAIPDEYIVPSGELEITASGIYDVKDYASANVEVTGGVVPQVGFTVDEWDSQGYATKVTVYGTEVPSYAFCTYQVTYTNIISKNLKEIIFSDGITTIGDYICYQCQSLEKITLPNTLTTIGMAAFRSAKNIGIKTIPDSVTTLGQQAFRDIVGLSQLSMKNVTNISASSSSTRFFGSASNLKAVWIGSAITSMGSNTFYGTTTVSKIFIDKPRVEVEAMSYYSNAFSNGTLTSDVIICNDDADFITKEEFDSINWSTQ